MTDFFHITEISRFAINQYIYNKQMEGVCFDNED